MFDALDSDNDGVLSKEELKKKVKFIVSGIRLGNSRAPLPQEQALIDKDVDEVIDEVFLIVDTDTDGTISREEFVSSFGSNPTAVYHIKELQKKMQEAETEPLDWPHSAIMYW